MSTAGTIDRPTTYDPTKQDPIMRHPSEPFGSHAPRHTSAIESRQNRNLEMQLIPEAMARAHMQDRLREAESQRTALRLVAARRMQRRAERASLRARRALAMAVMQ
ncbi:MULTISPECIES: hypothetical protein [Streptomyces]|uniref:Uncharacterized protein n=2 Tax=Streptomyces TaxID=1883 RepID=A0A939JSQ9_9ACTN|nr:MULTISPECIES: hypothetical protein [Streptomyces]MBO0654944.1 hypothetical protein [Streptomyces triculaminicus]QSY51174.1 hypothetical protein J3S04_09955 [Streptomyces griseocarneus]